MEKNRSKLEQQGFKTDATKQKVLDLVSRL